MMQNDGVEIFELLVADRHHVDAVRALLAQLTDRPVDFDIAMMRAITDAPSTHLFLLSFHGCVRGMLTLAEYVSPTGRKCSVEDVVVDASLRGKSLGRRLVEFALEYVARTGGGMVFLTSRSSRVAANNLYRSLGFVKKETNFYKKEVEAL